MQKVKLKPGERYCQRCFGNRLFYIRIENGRGVPAQPDNGICWRCRGNGKEPKKSVFTEYQKKNMRIVFEVLYIHEFMNAQHNMNFSLLVQHTRLSLYYIEIAVRGLRLCKYVYEYNLRPTELGLKKWRE